MNNACEKVKCEDHINRKADYTAYSLLNLKTIVQVFVQGPT